MEHARVRSGGIPICSNPIIGSKLNINVVIYSWSYVGCLKCNINCVADNPYKQVSMTYKVFYEKLISPVCNVYGLKKLLSLQILLLLSPLQYNDCFGVVYRLLKFQILWQLSSFGQPV